MQDFTSDGLSFPANAIEEFDLLYFPDSVHRTFFSRTLEIALLSCQCLISPKLFDMKNIQSKHLVILLMMTGSIYTGCQKDIGTKPSQEERSSMNTAGAGAEKKSKKVYVSNVQELYLAINNTENSGSTLVLAPGVYLLNEAFPKQGRLELLNNMSLSGQPGHPEQVVIDASELPLSSFTVVPTNARTGAIRMGDGYNSIEWITFQNDPAHVIRSLIQTDLVTTSSAQIRVAHCIIKGSSIGLSILNRDPVANGRTLEAIVEDNEIMGNTVPQFGSAIQIQNTLVHDAVLKVKLSRNHLHGNKSGMLIFNSSSQGCTLDVKSYNDRIEENGIGMVLNGGFILSGTVPSTNNKIQFEGYATSIKNNAGSPAPPFSFPAGGMHAAGGQSMPPFDPPGTAHNNQLDVRLFGCDLTDNSGNFQINAYGAHSFYPMLIPAGTGNTTRFYLHGLSAHATVNAMNSYPAEPAGTNSVTVFQ